MTRAKYLAPMLGVLLACTPGSKPAEQVVTPAPDSSLLSVPTLATWIDAGYLDDRGRKVVVLDTGYDPSLTTLADYEAGHIPGAHFVEVTEFYTERSEGHIIVPAMVPSGEVMDTFIQKHGIDDQTAIVLTGNHIWGPARTYFTFRYWGFPKENLFLLNGRKKLWETSGKELETTTPALPAPTSFSVADFKAKTAAKVSTAQLMKTIDEDAADVVIVDARTVLEWMGGLIPPANSIFGFQLKGSVWKEWSTLLVDGEKGPHLFKSAVQLQKDYREVGVNADRTVYAFCQAAGRAAVHFVALDLILGWPVKLHDGSSFELGQLGTTDDGQGNLVGLPEDSPWRFDREQYCSIVKYNEPSKIVMTKIVDAYADDANEVAATDGRYVGQ